jgi:hypothetical protein
MQFSELQTQRVTGGSVLERRDLLLYALHPGMKTEIGLERYNKCDHDEDDRHLERSACSGRPGKQEEHRSQANRNEDKKEITREKFSDNAAGQIPVKGLEYDRGNDDGEHEYAPRPYAEQEQIKKMSGAFHESLLHQIIPGLSRKP